jgi:hypothetical protein
MRTRALTGPTMIIAVLILQFIPLILLPPASYSLQNQEWWLSILLLLLVVAADIELIVRRSPAVWPWHLIGFAQGFNIISRLLLLWPRATLQTLATKSFEPNWTYIAYTLVSIALSLFVLWYAELPEVRQGLLRKAKA